MERRGFLKTLTAALAAAGVVKATPVESAPVAPASGVYGFKVAYKRSTTGDVPTDRVRIYGGEPTYVYSSTGPWFLTK